MNFVPDRIPVFLTIFNQSCGRIRRFDGCSHLELLRDMANENVFFTYSCWKDKKSLENYRNSELFKTTWGKTKELFAVKAEAWSLKRKHYKQGRSPKK